MLRENNLSPMISFTAKESPLKLCLEQNDLDSAHMLIKYDLFIEDMMS